MWYWTLIFSILTNGIVAQESILASDAVHRIVVKIDSAKFADGSTNGFMVSNIEIYSVQSQKLTQSIKGMQRLMAVPSKNLLMRFVDVNFDGFSDIWLLSNYDTDQQQWDFWTFEMSIGEFVKNDRLQGLQNPMIDTKSKTIHTDWSVGFSEFGHALYRWNNDSLLLLAEEIEIWDNQYTSTGTLTSRRWTDSIWTVSEIKITENIVSRHAQCEMLNLFEKE